MLNYNKALQPPYGYVHSGKFKLNIKTLENKTLSEQAGKRPRLEPHHKQILVYIEKHGVLHNENTAQYLHAAAPQESWILISWLNATS